MLEKAKITPDGITIYRRGCGHFLILLQALKDYGELEAVNQYLFGEQEDLPLPCREVLIMAARKFTDIRNPKRWVRRNTVKAIATLIEVIKYNSIPEKQGGTGKDRGIDDLAVDILEIVSRGGYASNPEYVFDQIDLPTVFQLKKRLEDREYTRSMLDLLIHHDPKGALTQLQKMQGITYTTWDELRKKKVKHG